MPRRCVLKCPPNPGMRFHTFPCQERKPESFKAWVQAIGGKLDTPEDYQYYRDKRICDRHFTPESKVRNNRVSALGVPSLYLSGLEDKQEISVQESPLLYHINLPAATSLMDKGLEDMQEISVQESPLLYHINLPAATSLMDKVTVVEEMSHKHILSVQSSMDLDINLPGTSSVINRETNSIEIQDISQGHNTVSVQSPLDLDINLPVASSIMNKVQMQEQKYLSSRKYNIYQKEIKQLKKTVKSLRKKEDNFKTRLCNAEKISNQSAFKRVTKNMTLPAKIFTNMQFRTTTKKPSGRRFLLDEKVLSLTLYKRSPKCYALLSRYFSLPAPKTLKRLLSDIKLSPGINKLIFEKLTKTVNDLSLEDRLCTLIFDEMSIYPQVHYDAAKDQLKGFSISNRSIADHALVFMVKGLKKNYKQPVAYYFTNSLNAFELKKLITEVMENVQKTGLVILSTICDQSTVNVSAINKLVEETKANYLRRNREWRKDFFEINKKKIIPLYDVPHLVKGLRNNLITKDMIYKDFEDKDKIKKVKWSYFQMLYEADKSYGELRCLQKLTEEHVNPEKIKKMRVKSATQLFSHSVAVATEHLTARGNLPQECRDLIPIVLLIDKLFDTLNGNTFHIPNGKKHKGPVNRNSPHHQLWQYAIKVLNTVKFVNKNSIEKVVPSTKNFVKTIEGMQALWKILSQKYSFGSMLTRSFNQDPVENFFGNIRSFGARNVAPNCVAFEAAFKALLLNNYNSPHSIHSNCEEDKNNVLQNLDFFIKEKYDLSSNRSQEPESITIRENFSLDLQGSHDAGQRTYVCGWVLTKCLKYIVKDCKTCRNSLLGNKEDQGSSYVRAKEYLKTKKWLCYPSLKVEKSFQDVQNITISHLKKDVPQENLRQTIKIFCDIFVDYPFDCLLHKDKLKDYFEDNVINVIIYSWCRSINRILCGKLTYNGVDDEVKLLAQKMYNKNKHKKENK